MAPIGFDFAVSAFVTPMPMAHHTLNPANALNAFHATCSVSRLTGGETTVR